MSKPGIGQSSLVYSNGIRYQDVFQCGALAADFEIAIGIAAFEFVVQIDQQCFDVGIFVDDLLRENEYAAVDHASMNFTNHVGAFIDRQELQCVIHYDHGCSRYLYLAHVCFENRDLRYTLVSGEYAATALDHRRRAVHGNDATVIYSNVLPDRECRRTE